MQPIVPPLNPPLCKIKQRFEITLFFTLLLIFSDTRSVAEQPYNICETKLAGPKGRAGWNRDNVLVAIRQLHTAGFELNFTNMRDDPDGKISRFLQDLNLVTKGAAAKSLMRAASRYYENWGLALSAAGLEIKKIQPQSTTSGRNNSNPQQWSRAQVTSGIKTLVQSGLKIRTLADTIQAGPSARAVLDQLSQLTPLPSTRLSNLVAAAIYHFGNWPAAYEWAVPSPPDFTQQDIQAALQAIAKRKLVLSVFRLKYDRSGLFSEILRESRLPLANGRRLLKGILRYYPDLKQPAQEFGIELAENPPPIQWSKESLCAVLRKLYDLGYSINVASVFHDREGLIAKFLRKGDYPDTKAITLYHAGLKFFTTWDGTLRAAGLDPGLIRQQGWKASLTEVHAALQVLADLKVKLSRKSLLEDQNGVIQKALTEAKLPFKDTRILYREIVSHYPQPELAFAEFNISYVPREGAIKWTPESMIEVLQKLHALGYALNVSSLFWDRSGVITRFLAEGDYANPAPRTLYHAGRKYFGTWDEALLAAGIDPDTIRIRGWAAYRILSLELQNERREAAQTKSWLPTRTALRTGLDDLAEIEVVDPSDMEQDLIRKDQAEHIDQAIEALDAEDRQLFTALIESVEENGIDNENQTDLAGYFSRQLATQFGVSPEILKPHIEKLMAQLLSNAHLREALD